MGGSSGQTASYQKQGANQGLANSNAWQASQNNPTIAQLMSSYGSGGMSYQDMLKGASGIGGGDTSGIDSQIKGLENQANSGWNESGANPHLGEIQDQIATLQAQKQAMGAMGGSSAMDDLALGTGTGYKLASDQVMNNPLYAGLFGQGGLGEKAQGQYDTSSRDLDTDRQSLMGKDESYGLTPQDLAAYGQASDSIGRQFGAQGNSLAQALADRGLSSGDNGVAAQSFSGLMGNQNEQLARAQMGIAQNRIQTAMGLAQSRTQMDLSRQSQAGQLGLGLGNLGNSAQQAAYGQNIQGIQTRAGLSGNAAQLSMADQAQRQEIANEAFAQLQATKSPSLGQAFTSGLTQGFGSLGSNLGSGGVQGASQIWSGGGAGGMSSNPYSQQPQQGQQQQQGKGGMASMSSMFA